MYTQRGQSTPAAANLLEGLPHLLAPEGINERVYNRVAHNEDQIHVEVGHETDAIRVPRAGDHEDEVQKKGSPAHHEYTQQDSDGDGPFHICRLPDRDVAREGSNALHVQSG